MIKHFLLVSALYLYFLPSINYSQTKDNLNIFYSLIDSVVNYIDTKIPAAEKISLNSTMPDDFFAFHGRIITVFRNTGREILTEKGTKEYNVNILLNKAQVKYSDIFNEKLFGDYKVKRIISLWGNYNINKNGLVFSSEELVYEKVDTINYDDIKSLENPSLPFTRGVTPSEPFFSSLLEPVIAVSAVALTVILFFTVRSK